MNTKMVLNQLLFPECVSALEVLRIEIASPGERPSTNLKFFAMT